MSAGPPPLFDVMSFSRWITEVFTEELAMDMAVDVMYDRGFRVRVEENRSFIDKRSSFHFKITFTPPTLHNAAEHS